MHTKTYQIEKTPQLKPELLVFLFNTISHSHLAPSVSDPFLVHLCLFPPHCFFIALLHLHSPYLTPSPVFFSSPCLFLPSFLPSSSSQQGSQGNWHFSNSRRGICTRQQPMLGKEGGCGMADRGLCVFVSVHVSVCV